MVVSVSSSFGFPANPTKFPFEIEQTSYEQLLSNPLLGTKSQPDVEARKECLCPPLMPVLLHIPPKKSLLFFFLFVL